MFWSLDEEIPILVEEPALRPLVPEFDAGLAKPARPLEIEQPYHAEFDDTERTNVGSRSATRWIERDQVDGAAERPCRFFKVAA